jgi:hypothetical protein
MLVAEHELQKAAGQVQDPAWPAAAHHLNFRSGTHTQRPQALNQHRMGWQGLQPHPAPLHDTAQRHRDENILP